VTKAIKKIKNAKDENQGKNFILQNNIHKNKNGYNIKI